MGADRPAQLRALMEKLISLDPAGFGPGSATWTLAHPMSVVVIGRGDDRLAITGRRSLARKLWHAPDTAAGLLAPPG